MVPFLFRLLQGLKPVSFGLAGGLHTREGSNSRKTTKDGINMQVSEGHANWLTVAIRIGQLDGANSPKGIPKMLLEE